MHATTGACRLHGFQPFVGQHCETAATGSLLKAAGIELSEPMLFGLGEGLSFVFLNLSSLPLPFVGGRVKPFELTTALCRNLGVDCEASETSSRPKAWAAIEKPLLAGQPVGLQLDCFHLEYFSRPIHFAGHFVAVYGFDETSVHVVDTRQQGTLQRVARQRLEAARFEKGPMSARARSWTITAPRRRPELARAIRGALRATAGNYLEPPFKGASYLGIRKLADSLPGWLQLAPDPANDLELAAALMENAGTGGALFRNFYRDFLDESRDHLGASADLQRAHGLFAEAATQWAAVAADLRAAARGATQAPLREAAQRCRTLVDLEVEAMQRLVAL